MNLLKAIPSSFCCYIILSCWVPSSHSQPYGQPDRDLPGDLMIQDYLRRETERIETNFPFKTAAQWQAERPRLLREYYHMLGLWPLPPKTPLKPTITGTLDRGDYFVDLLHYQSRPGLYVTANLYRPAKVPEGQRLPAVLYVCGHSSRGRNGNKTAFQSHGIWFARHGYVCLMVDTLQLGEIAGIHHGTYRENRWWWISRGYTPAGVECWNGIRGIDYLASRDDVDPAKIAVTGISGGGAATFWIAAADDRVKVAVPVSGMADLASYVPNRVINGHCDCMFLYNTYQWPWTTIAALIAPRPMLFVNSDKDPIFPMDANERVISRLERVYSAFGDSDVVDSFVSVGGHDYRADIRRAVYRFINTHLKVESAPVTDSEVDLVTGPRESIHPIPPEELRVFPAEFPSDAINSRIDEEFVPMVTSSVPTADKFSRWKISLVQQLREVTFRHFPEQLPTGKAVGDGKEPQIETENGVRIAVRKVKEGGANPKRAHLFIATNSQDALPTWFEEMVSNEEVVYVCEPRGFGGTRWTRKNPPNYVERSHYLLGRTVDSGRILDVVAAAGYLRAEVNPGTSLHLAAEGPCAVLAMYAALLDVAIEGLTLRSPPATHMDSSAPALLNVLRVCDLPDVLGMLAPRKVTVLAADKTRFERAVQLYRVTGKGENLSFR